MTGQLGINGWGEQKILSIHPFKISCLSRILSWNPGFLVGQLCSALGAAAGQDLTAVGGGHSLPEAADLRAVALLGLVGTNGSHCWVHLLIRICSTAAKVAAASSQFGHKIPQVEICEYYYIV